jgi:hypothetical protein
VTSRKGSSALLAKERIQVVQHRASAFYSCVIVVVCLDDPADEPRNSRSLGPIELFVFAVNVVNYLADRAECRVAKTELSKERLKCAGLSDVRVFGFVHVESELATLRPIASGSDELELRIGVDVATDKPRTRDAIYVHVLTSDPGSPGLNFVDGSHCSILGPAKPSFGFEHRFQLLIGDAADKLRFGDHRTPALGLDLSSQPL